jgi:hypothetical protein
MSPLLYQSCYAHFVFISPFSIKSLCSSTIVIFCGNSTSFLFQAPAHLFGSELHRVLHCSVGCCNCWSCWPYSGYSSPSRGPSRKCQRYCHPSQDTLNGTLISGTVGQVNGAAIIDANVQLSLAFENNYGAASVNVYITSEDTNRDIVFVTANGQFYYPPSTTSTTPVEITADVVVPLSGQRTTSSLTLPDYLSSGRV